MAEEKEQAAFIDSHCHLHLEVFEKDRSEVIARAEEAGLESIINIGVDRKSSHKGLELAENFEHLYTTVGIHPHEANTVDEAAMEDLHQMAGSSSAVLAIGETGLDYHYLNSPREVQISAFRRHLEAARSLDLPVVIHSREAQEDTLKILRQEGISLKGVLHCFSGNWEMARKALDMGFFISIAGTVTFKNADTLREVVKQIPDDRLLIETDAPYLSPQPKRGRRNEPSFLVHTAEFIAALRGVSLSDIARITTKNTKEFFKIGQLHQEGKLAYKIRDSLYLNITRRCTNICSFCTKFQSDYVKGHYLKLKKEPTLDALLKAIGRPSDYSEVVFCGLGEPLLRLDLIKTVSRWVQERGGKVRINTNGQGNLIHGRNILPELIGLVDSLSISLDAENEEKYNRICRPTLKGAYQAVVSFIREAVRYIPDVEVSVVETPSVDIEKCKAIADQFHARFRVRKLNVVG